MQFKNMLQRSLKWASSWRFLKWQKVLSILSFEESETKSIDEKPGRPTVEATSCGSSSAPMGSRTKRGNVNGDHENG